MQSSTSCTSRIFKDGNAERVGDFPGLIQKLDHLQDLGVPCLWLRPRSLHTLKTMATTFRPDERPLDVEDNGGFRDLFSSGSRAQLADDDRGSESHLRVRTHGFGARARLLTRRSAISTLWSDTDQKRGPNTRNTLMRQSCYASSSKAKLSRSAELSILRTGRFRVPSAI
jgi:hypothetical protein